MDLHCGDDGVYPEHLAVALDWHKRENALDGIEDVVKNIEAHVQSAMQAVRERPDGWNAEVLFVAKRASSPPGEGNNSSANRSVRNNMGTSQLRHNTVNTASSPRSEPLVKRLDSAEVDKRDTGSENDQTKTPQGKIRNRAGNNGTRIRSGRSPKDKQISGSSSQMESQANAISSSQ
jgi:hypothetical protein